MTNKQFIQAVAARSNVSDKIAEDVIAAAIAVIRETLQRGGNVLLMFFGRFAVRERTSFIGRNPKTGGRVLIPAAKIPVFKASAILKEYVNSSDSP